MSLALKRLTDKAARLRERASPETAQPVDQVASALSALLRLWSFPASQQSFCLQDDTLPWWSLTTPRWLVLPKRISYGARDEAVCDTLPLLQDALRKEQEHDTRVRQRLTTDIWDTTVPQYILKGDGVWICCFRSPFSMALMSLYEALSSAFNPRFGDGLADGVWRTLVLECKAQFAAFREKCANISAPLEKAVSEVERSLGQLSEASVRDMIRTPRGSRLQITDSMLALLFLAQYPSMVTEHVLATLFFLEKDGATPVSKPYLEQKDLRDTELLQILQSVVEELSSAVYAAKSAVAQQPEVIDGRRVTKPYKHVGAFHFAGALVQTGTQSNARSGK